MESETEAAKLDGWNWTVGQAAACNNELIWKSTGLKRSTRRLDPLDYETKGEKFRKASEVARIGGDYSDAEARGTCGDQGVVRQASLPDAHVVVFDG